MQRVFRVVDTAGLKPVGPQTTNQFNASIRRNGIVNPVLLAEVVDADGVIDLAIIDGNRRIRAAQIARQPKAPAVVLKGTTKQDRARLSLMCNYMRSANFHTESTAILALAADEQAAAGAARAMGLGAAKMQQLYRKIATMPEPVRRAMYEHRIPVTAATWVGAWPEGLQQELIELLGRRRYVNTTMVKDLREWYAERHPREFGIVEQPDEDVPFDEWTSTDIRVVDIPSPPSSPDNGSTVPDTFDDSGREPASDEAGDATSIVSAASPSVASGVDALPVAAAGSLAMAADRVVVAPHSAAPMPERFPPAERVASASAPGMAPTVAPAQAVVRVEHPIATPVATEPAEHDDDPVERRMAFVIRLDAAMRELAREGQKLGIDRSVWVDRTMRAWDGIRA